MEEINKWFALRQTHEELKKLYETSVRVNVFYEATVSQVKADAALMLEAAARRHLKEKHAMQQGWDKELAAPSSDVSCSPHSVNAGPPAQQT